MIVKSSYSYLYIDLLFLAICIGTVSYTHLHMTKNTIAGCTFVLNRDMATLITDAGKPNYRVIKYRLHDAWIMLIAIACGRVIYAVSYTHLDVYKRQAMACPFQQSLQQLA